eukprot:365159-Chlamydomonas_euryale.AAC.20
MMKRSSSNPSFKLKPATSMPGATGARRRSAPALPCPGTRAPPPFACHRSVSQPRAVTSSRPAGGGMADLPHPTAAAKRASLIPKQRSNSPPLSRNAPDPRGPTPRCVEGRPQAGRIAWRCAPSPGRLAFSLPLTFRGSSIRAAAKAGSAV